MNRRLIPALAAAISLLAVGALLGACGGTSSKTTATAGTTAANASPQHTTVPAVKGSSLADARKKLAAAHLSLQIRQRYSNDARGQVIAIQPAAGATMKLGAWVTLVVSRGPRPVAQAPTPTPSSSSRAGCPPGEYTSSSGSCVKSPPSYGGSPPVNSPEGQHALHTSPDCPGAPPPPPGYKGPVQC